MKKTLLLAAASVALSFSVSQSSHAQGLVLLEEATNASCPPCASQNPDLEMWLQSHEDEVVQIAYHAWWPGSTDPMYLNDASMNRTRITYYGFDKIGVPTCVINGHYTTAMDGWYGGAPGDINGLDNALDSIHTATVDKASPITLAPKRFIDGDSEVVQITATANQAITGAYLRVVVVEAQHEYTDAGSNGETVFPNLARKMLPAAKGTALTLAAGQTKIFTFKYLPKQDWNVDDLSVIAYVQSDKDKSVSGVVKSTEAPSILPATVKSRTGSNEVLSVKLSDNPFVSHTQVQYTVADNVSMSIRFTIVDMLGREVRTLKSGVVGSGAHTLDLNSANLAAGTYKLVAETPKGIVQVPFVIEH